MTNSTQEELERESRSCGVRTDLAPDGIVDVSGVLRLLIADVSGLYVTTTHLFLDEHGDGIFGTTDHIAEHARKFGGSTIRAISSVQRPLNEAKPLVSGAADYGTDPSDAEGALSRTLNHNSPRGLQENLTLAACSHGPQPLPPNEHLERAFQKVHVLAQVSVRNNAEEKARQAAKELERSEAMIRRLIDANVLGFFIWHLEGAIVGSNEAFLRMLQFSREDLVLGRVRWTDLTPAEWREYDERALARLRTSGTVEPYEKEYFRKDGSRVPVIVAGALFEEGSIEGVTFALDLTTQKRAEAEIRTLKEQLCRENLALRDEVDGSTMFEEIVGTSKPLKAVLSRIAKVAPTDSTVFITGETGTGKELIARAVHKRSLRSGRTFVSVNCAALSPSLISSELFGHEKGAFTGATQKRLGRFELADGGTIFLDEVGELLPDVQAALLRVLQEREFERVGGGRPLRVDVRVIAATNQDLKLAVANGTFRQDLFYRLNVFPIEVPPLRHRQEDILMLVQYFVQRYAAKMAKNICAIDKKTLDLLQSYDWPGNIRELQNVIERSVILSSDEVLSIDESWLSKDTWGPKPRGEPSAVFKIEGGPLGEREIIEAALAETRGRVSGPSGAAAKLRIPASTLATRIKALKINKNQFKFG